MSVPDNNGGQRKGGLKQAFEAAKPALNLTTEQEKKIREIFKDFLEERHDIKNASGDAMADDMHDARQQARHQVMTVLNDEQKKTWQQHLSDWRNS